MRAYDDASALLGKYDPVFWTCARDLVFFSNLTQFAYKKVGW